ncbi:MULTISPECIES: hypothetical protein [unclassified Streptomyces]|uniref:hypothetical protein n=1 Tax=unclassified Streptomyces TaxID=2593676 RepID=UPI002E786BB3|nr:MULTISPECIES: hypothetical protein [unclassified Streptomyces]MEE1759875.1 hypothetical protein [Streptomyces sp. SP18BB07]MEE1833324.1 hypothetical protein [Streptomyces sp. SP17KL33]
MFAAPVNGNAVSMTGPNKDPNENSASAETTAAKARRTAGKATAPATASAKTAAVKVDGATSSAKAGAGHAADAAKRAADSTNSAVHSAVKGVEAGRQAVVQASGQVAATAKTAMTVIAHRKLVAAGVGAGLTALTAASYAVGRRSGRQVQGPITRLTGGRI